MNSVNEKLLPNELLNVRKTSIYTGEVEWVTEDDARSALSGWYHGEEPAWKTFDRTGLASNPHCFYELRSVLRKCATCGCLETDDNSVTSEADECQQCWEKRRDLASAGIYS